METVTLLSQTQNLYINTLRHQHLFRLGVQWRGGNLGMTDKYLLPVLEKVKTERKRTLHKGVVLCIKAVQ